MTDTETDDTWTMSPPDKLDVILDAIDLALDKLTFDPTWQPHEDYTYSFPTRLNYITTLEAARKDIEKRASGKASSERPLTS